MHIYMHTYSNIYGVMESHTIFVYVYAYVIKLLHVVVTSLNHPDILQSGVDFVFMGYSYVHI